MRKQSEKAPAPFFNIGASSLLVIFLILCLVTFAILTLTSAKSDADFAEKLAHHKMNYYAACNTAESTLDKIDAVLADAWQLSDTDTAAVFTEIETQLTALDSREQLQLSMDFTQSEPTISYAVAIDDKQNLCVTLTTAFHSGRFSLPVSGRAIRL